VTNINLYPSSHCFQLPHSIGQVIVFDNRVPLVNAFVLSNCRAYRCK